MAPKVFEVEDVSADTVNQEKRRGCAMGSNRHQQGTGLCFFRDGFRFPFLANQGGKFPGSAGLEERGQSHLDIEPFPDFRKEPHGQQGVSTRFKEIRMGIRLVDAQQLLPELQQHRLDRIVVCHHGRRQLGGFLDRYGQRGICRWYR
jgi:hypothetical protein